VFEVYHAHVKAHNRDGETVEETLRRLSRMPDPHEFAGPFAPEEVDRIESAIEEPNERESERLRTVPETFGAEEPSWIRRTSSTSSGRTPRRSRRDWNSGSRPSRVGYRHTSSSNCSPGSERHGERKNGGGSRTSRLAIPRDHRERIGRLAGRSLGRLEAQSRADGEPSGADIGYAYVAASARLLD